MVIFSVVVGALQYTYWIEALRVAQSATIWRGSPYWTSGGPGTFLPWPREPGMLAVMTPMANPIDQFVFHLTQTQLFIPIAVGITLLFGCFGWLAGGLLKRKGG